MCIQRLITRPCPLRNLRVIRVTSTALTISWQRFDTTHHLEIIYGYVVKRCSAPIGLPRKEVTRNTATSRTLTGLPEDSSYTIIVQVVNSTGSSTVDTLTVETLTAGELILVMQLEE